MRGCIKRHKVTQARSRSFTAQSSSLKPDINNNINIRDNNENFVKKCFEKNIFFDKLDLVEMVKKLLKKIDQENIGEKKFCPEIFGHVIPIHSFQSLSVCKFLHINLLYPFIPILVCPSL